jgi:phage terminase small subunit
MVMPRKTAAELKLHGTYRDDRHGERNEPEMPGIPEKPDNLAEHASWFWDRTVPGLVANGVVKEADSAALLAACRLWHLFVVAMGEAELDPLDKNAACRAAQYHSAWDRAASKLGLTPVDRRRVAAEKPQRNDDDGIPTRNRA